MLKLIHKHLKLIIKAISYIGLLTLSFYIGIIFQEIKAEGINKFIKEQIVSIFFGVIGGITTSVVLLYIKMAADNFRLSNKQDTILSGYWDEFYTPTEFKEVKQEQCLNFRIEHRGNKITGILIGIDNPDYPELPDKDRHGVRAFTVNGHVEGKLVSISAILNSDDSLGHTVYLLEINHNYTVLEGITTYLDKNENVITTAKTRLVKRKKKYN